jgi:hypothetical protein
MRQEQRKIALKRHRLYFVLYRPTKATQIDSSAAKHFEISKGKATQIDGTLFCRTVVFTSKTSVKIIFTISELIVRFVLAKHIRAPA